MGYRQDPSGSSEARPPEAPGATTYPTICYLLSHYISHRKAGAALMECLNALGAPLVDDPERADIVVLHNEPWSYAGYYRAIPALRNKRVIAYAVWETDVLPEHFRFNLGLVDEIWTCSSYCRNALLAAGRKVSIVPHVVAPPERDPAAERRVRERIGYDEDMFYFYTIVGGANPRKNLPAAIKAFAEVFKADSEKVRFLVKSPRPIPDTLAKLPGVIPVSDHFDAAEIDALHHLCHCFVSPHRSEGWGLGISEAMAAGNVVVATGFSGNMDFMTPENSLPLAYRLETIRDDEVRRQSAILTKAMSWAYVDDDDLRRKLRQSFDDREALRPLGLRAAEDMRRFAPARVAEILRARLAGL